MRACQLGDDSAANLLKEDPKLLHFIQQEQDHLEQQVRRKEREGKESNLCGAKQRSQLASAYVNPGD